MYNQEIVSFTMCILLYASICLSKEWRETLSVYYLHYIALKRSNLKWKFLKKIIIIIMVMILKVPKYITPLFHNATKIIVASSFFSTISPLVFLKWNISQRTRSVQRRLFFVFNPKRACERAHPSVPHITVAYMLSRNAVALAIKLIESNRPRASTY